MPNGFRPEAPKMPKMGTPGTETSEAVALKVREEGFAPGPAESPHIMEKAPHQDTAQIVDGIIANLQEAGATICGVLDKPFDATIKIKGPHRIVDVTLAVPTGIARELIQRYMK